MALPQSRLSIEELDGDLRRVVLIGPTLPFKGAEWSAALSVVTTWYQGNPEDATQQVLVAHELPSSWEGRWSRAQMGKSPATYYSGEGASPESITVPFVLMQLLEDMFRSGSLLRVIWSTVTSDGVERGSIQRLGRATEFGFPVQNYHDIAWRVTFDWKSRGDETQKTVALRTGNLDASVASIGTAVNEAATAMLLAKFKASNRTIRKSASSFSLGQLESLVAYPDALMESFMRSIQQKTNELKRIADLYNKVRNIPSHAQNRVLALTQNMVANCNQFSQTLTARPAEAGAATNRVADILRSMNNIGEAHDASVITARRAQEAADRLNNAKAASQGDRSCSSRHTRGMRPNLVLAVHIVKVGDTWNTISSKYYHNPDNAQAIIRCNRLGFGDLMDGPKVGKVLIIPSTLENKAGLYWRG
jgi:hypothetical protein